MLVFEHGFREVNLRGRLDCLD